MRYDLFLSLLHFYSYMKLNMPFEPQQISCFSFPSNHNLPPSLSSLNHLSATKILFLCCHSAVTSPALLHASQHKASFLLATASVWLQGRTLHGKCPIHQATSLTDGLFCWGQSTKDYFSLHNNFFNLISNIYRSLLFC